jgi:hypothetical protein
MASDSAACERAVESQADDKRETQQIAEEHFKPCLGAKRKKEAAKQRPS